MAGGVEVPLLVLIFVNGRGAVARSARLCAELLKDCFSLPRSSRKERIMEAISEGESREAEQYVQGPMPSFTQIILPQLRQLGAAARRGWRVALQGQAREEVEAGWREGLVWSSRARMAES